MMENRLEQAKAALRGEVTFAAVLADGRVITSEKKGIAPMMALLKEDADILKGACVADRVIGKAASLLMEKGGVMAVYGDIISSHAMSIYKKNGTPVTCGKEVPYIINWAKTGMCLMEQTVLEIEDAEEAYEALKRKLVELGSARG